MADTVRYLMEEMVPELEVSSCFSPSSSHTSLLFRVVEVENGRLLPLDAGFIWIEHLAPTAAFLSVRTLSAGATSQRPRSGRS